MAMVSVGTPEMAEMAQKAIALVQDCIADAEEDEKTETKEKLSDAKAAARGNEALAAAMAALEALMAETCKGKVFMDQFNAEGELSARTMALMGTRPHAVLAKLREALWLAKDALALCKDAGDKFGQAACQLALARIHLVRPEPDAAPAAIRAATEGLRCLKRSGQPKREAMAYIVLAEANYMKGVLTIIEGKREAALETSMSAAKDAAAILRELGEKKAEGLALLTLAVTLSAMSDEDRLLEGERYAGDAQELFKACKERDLEKDAALLLITARWEASGPETALLIAQETVSDWRSSGGRELHEAAALRLSAQINLELQENAQAQKECQEALRLCVRSGKRRMEAEVLHTQAQVQLAMKNNDSALQSLQDMVAIYQSMGDKQMTGFAQGLIAELLLMNLANEVTEDTVAIHEKKEVPHKLLIDDVYARNEEGIDYCFKALDNYQTVGDQNGLDAVNKLMDDIYQQGVNVYCQTTEPDQLYIKLESNANAPQTVMGTGPKTKKTWKEWNIEMPRVKRAVAEEMQQLGGGARLALK